MKKTILRNAAVVCMLLSPTFCAASNFTEVARYTTVKNQSSRAQVNPLLMTVQTRFPQSVQTVGQAMNYILRYSGFSLVNREKMDGNVVQMLNQPLPIVDRRLGPVMLQDALATLAGKNVFKLTQDPLHRKLSFELLPEIKKQYL